MILNEAEYWPAASARRVHDITAGSYGPPVRWLYLVTPPVPAMTKKLKFTIQSHDQGWSGESADTKGTYVPSYTWFEAAILRPDGNNTESDASAGLSEISEGTTVQDPERPPGEHISSSPELSDILRAVAEEGPKNVTTDGENWPGKGWKIVPESQQLLQRNVQAQRYFKVHELVWELGTEGKKWDRETGAGRGVGFVEALMPGDRVAVLAHAVFPGWENTVNGVEVELFYSV